ncbi:MAG: ArsR family transcriptional regulator [Thiotrichales bacterium]|nr:ArsR family transcriptional regulator [Thiotrichales bacterium]|tara:strand:- start:91 stop:549 length:459 start_codon:yes stop_codon:yes gene_type:complete
MDRIDKRILAHLQEDSNESVADIAHSVGLSTTPCWRRIQKLERAGVVRKRVALLDRHEINLGVDVFVAIKTNQHNAKWLAGFTAVVEDLPEVVEFYRMSGDIDYLMRVVVQDISAFDKFYKRLIERVQLSDVSSSFAMEQIKYTTALPLDHA